MTASLMNDYAAMLAAGRRVITVELQGHGHTRDIGRPLRYELLADDIAALEQLSGSIYHQAYRDVAPDPERWPGLVRKVLDLDAQPQDWPAARVAAIAAPTMLVVADSDIVRLEHAVEMFHLLGGGVAGDIHGLPAARLAVVPGTTHTGLCDRAEWVVPMIAEFLDDAGG